MENRPRLLLLDEPTANLDSDNTARVEEMLRTYCEETGAAVLWVGHRQTQLQRVANRILHMSGGQISDDGGGR